MFEGLWIVQYAGMEGKDGGVVVLTKGHVLGGDSAFTYIGTYQEYGNGFQATVLVQNYNPAVGNVLGISGDFTLNLRATVAGNGVLQGEGSTPSAPGFGLKVKLTRRANMP
jgi:hypothetical protein